MDYGKSKITNNYQKITNMNKFGGFWRKYLQMSIFFRNFVAEIYAQARRRPLSC